MAAQKAARTESVPSSTEAGFEINGQRFVELFDQDGKSLLVRGQDVDSFLAKGFAREAFDAMELCAKFETACDAVKPLLRAYVDGVLGDGFIDTSDASNERALLDGLGLLAGAVHKTLDGIGARYLTRANFEAAKEIA